MCQKGAHCLIKMVQYSKRFNVQIAGGGLSGRPKKHCQRHNGPRVLSSKLNSIFHLKLFQIDFSQNRMTQLALVENLPTRWRYLHWLIIWPTCNAISIGSNFGHHVAMFALVTNLATRWHHLH